MINSNLLDENINNNKGLEYEQHNEKRFQKNLSGGHMFNDIVNDSM